VSLSKNNNVPEAVITFNHLECVEDVNSAALNLLCKGSQVDLIGRSTIEVFGTNLAQLLSKRNLTLTSASGLRFPAQLSLSEWMEDERPRYTLVIRDVTEQTQIDRMKDEFLATVSHELRTPLASVLGALGLLSAGATGALNESARTLTDVAYRNGLRLSRLVDDILDLTKLESDRLVLVQKPVGVLELVREAIEANETLATSSQVSLRLIVTDDLAARATVMLDPDRFNQIMTNLLSNAIKHTPAGQEVRVSIQISNMRIFVSVKDSGPGIEPIFLGRVFDKFSQADASDRRAQGGMGLGLYITKMLVERMKGTVNVESRPGQGAEFIVEFSLDTQHSVSNQKRILHIDSDLDARLRVARWLEGKAVLTSVASAAQAKAQGMGISSLSVIANPKAQGSLSDFYSDVRYLAKGQEVYIYGDCVEQASATYEGFQWLSAAETSQSDFIDAVLFKARHDQRLSLA
jgi:signal transduction histidine kinase